MPNCQNIRCDNSQQICAKLLPPALFSGVTQRGENFKNIKLSLMTFIFAGFEVSLDTPTAALLSASDLHREVDAVKAVQCRQG